MAGNKQSIGDGRLTFGPVKIDYGPKGTTTHFTVTCITLGPLIAYYNYIIQFGASGTFMGTDTGLDGSTTAADKALEVSFPGLPSGYGALSELLFDCWELLTNENTDSIFNNPLIVGSTGWMTDNDKVVLSYVATNGLTIPSAVSTANAAITAGTLPPPAATTT